MLKRAVYMYYNDNMYFLKEKPIYIYDYAYISSNNVYDDQNMIFDDRIKVTIEDYYKGINNNVLEYSLSGLKDKIPACDENGYLFFSLTSEDEKSIIFIIDGGVRGKLWCNYKNLGPLKNGSSEYRFTLNKGNNVIVVEIYNPNKKVDLCFRISTVLFEDSQEEVSLNSNNLDYYNDVVAVYSGQVNIRIGDDIKFTFFPYDMLDIDLSQKIMINVIRRNPIEKIDTLHTSFFKNTIINTLSYNYDNNNGFNNIYLECIYLDRRSKERKKYINLFFHDVEPSVVYLKNLAINTLNRYSHTEYDEIAINYLLELQEIVGLNTPTAFLYGAEIIRYVKAIQEGRNILSLIQNNEMDGLYFRSILDNSVNRIFIHVPNNYNPSINYPLLINITTSDYKETCSLENYKGDFISANISGRGVTLGSYVGEAFLLECINKIIELFSVDEKKIHIFGFSGTATAALALAQLYPDKITSVVATSGATIESCIDNLKKVCFYTISSDSDGNIGPAYKIPIKKLKNNNLFKALLSKAYCHQTIKTIRFNKIIIDEVLKHEIDKYPRKFNYKTLHTHHNKIFWIEIISIKKDKSYAYISCDAGENYINLRVYHCTGIKITLPPFINRKRFTIRINNKEVDLIDYKEDCIYLNNKNGYYISKNKIICCTPKYKGLGLLYPYLFPLRIITNKYDEALMNVATVFSSPSANSYDPTIYVKYPIDDFLEFNISEKYKYIIIDNNSENSLIKTIRYNCKVKTSIHGTSYKDFEYIGDYIVMQMIYAKIDGKNLCALYINTNNPELFKKNIFTRRLFIPSYKSGIHPQLNKAVVAYFNNNYYTIDEY